MKISLITATFNSASTLRDTIESILSQTYPDIEYIIKDGGSKDATLDIIREYEPKFNGRMKWISEKDNGIYDAMNKGIKMATGDVVGILNSDDLLIDNTAIFDIINMFDDEIEATYGNLYFVKNNNTDEIVRTWKGSQYRSFKSGWHPAHPTFYVRKSIYDKYGFFDTSFDVSADFELMLRFIEKYRIKTKYIDRYIVKMRVGGESTGSISKIITGNRNVMRAFKKNEISVSPFYLVKRLLPKAINMIENKLHLK